MVLNTWEAVYFDHELDRLRHLAERAARVGVERFVLDDGWFRGRRDETRGLGDWTVDPALWPEGLDPLVQHERALGMQFGLWVEPEMVNLDSDLARAHPDWVLRGRTDARPPSWRHQQVLDLQHPDAWRHLRTRLDDSSAAMTSRTSSGTTTATWSTPATPAARPYTVRPSRCTGCSTSCPVGTPVSRSRAARPGAAGSISASSPAPNRVWASDTNDALERQSIQRWTQQLLPPELVGSHVGGPVSHTTGRRHTLSFRAVTALFGHLGIEWDLTARPARRSSPSSQAPPLTVPDLDPAATYEVQLVGTYETEPRSHRSGVW